MKKVKTDYHHCLRQLSDRIVKAQDPIRILDMLKWGEDIEKQFFAKKCKELPAINKEYYLKNTLPFSLEEKEEEFHQLERDISKEVGQFSSVGTIMLRMCREYRDVLRLIKVRGTTEFSLLSQELYGSADDAFYINAPRLKDLAKLISDALHKIKDKTENELDIKRYTSEEAVKLLNEWLSQYFAKSKISQPVRVSDGLVADAAAGSEVIKIRSNALFSERELRILAVHEGWVHLGTTLNGMHQPICTFLSKGTPSTTITQEGLAIIMEIFTFVSAPARLKKLMDRVTIIDMVENGADFLQVFNFLLTQNYTPEESYKSAVRVFRGSLPNQGPFTKDLVYSKGFVLINNYLRLAVQDGMLDRIPLLFIGKTSLEDQRLLAHLVEEGLVSPPVYVPPQLNDLAALSCWVCFSLFLNKLDLSKIAIDYRNILEG